MNEKMKSIKAALAAVLTAASTLLGWRGIMAIVWVVSMALDYISGSAAACRSGQWNSEQAREGLWHKGAMIVVVIVAGIADLVMSMICAHLPIGLSWPGLVWPLVLAWYIITELGSILENAIKLGAKVPTWLIRLMKSGLKAVNAAADTLPAPQEEAQARQEEQET